MDINKQYNQLLFSIGRSIRYHRKRTRFFEIVNSIILFLILLLSSASFISILELSALHYNYWQTIVLGIITFGTALNLSFNIVRKISTHSKLTYLFRELERKIKIEKNRNEDSLKNFINERLRIELEEPPVLRVLNAICFNEESIAQGFSVRRNIKVYQLLFAYFHDLPPTEIPIHHKNTPN